MVVLFPMKIRLLSLAFLFFSIASKAQVVSVSPSSAFLSQTVSTTITLSSGILQAGTPLATTDIYIEQSGYKIYTDAFSISQIYPGTPPYDDSLTTDFTIPAGAILGWYDVHVITYAPGPIDNILVNGFLIPAVGSCPVPFNVNASTVTGSSELISWSPTVIADTFRIRYRPSGTNNYSYMDVDGAGSVTSATISNLTPGVLYDVDVSTRCTGISSTYSVPIDTFTTLSQVQNCTIPFGITITPVTSTTAQVNWTNLVSADTFRIRYYQTPGNYKYIDVNGGGAHSFTITNLIPNSSYNVQLSTVCLGTGNGYSPVISFVTLSGQVNCVIPWGVDTSNVTGSTANILWSASVTADTFRIKYRKQSGGPDLYKNVNGSSHNGVLQNLDPNTVYIYQVSSVCLGIGSGYSAVKSFVTTNTFLPCTTIPFGLSSNATSNSTATISWTPLVSADSFLVRYSVNGTQNYIWKKVSGLAGNTTTLTGLTPNTTYQWQVRTACNAAPPTTYSVSDIFGTPLRLAQSISESDDITLFPNPATESIHVVFSSSEEKNIMVQITDISGRVLYVDNFIAINGRNHFQAPVSDFSSGIYFLRIFSGNTLFGKLHFIVE